MRRSVAIATLLLRSQSTKIVRQCRNSRLISSPIPWSNRPSIASITHQRRWTSSLGYCPGCGAPFQQSDTSKPGFLVAPKDSVPIQRKRTKDMTMDAYEAAVASLDPETRAMLLDQDQGEETMATLHNATSEEIAKRMVCQRCHTLQHHHKSTTETSTDFLRHSQQFGSLAFLRTKQDPLLVVVLDITDLPFSLSQQTVDLVRQNPGTRLIVAANKVDLLPARARSHTQRLQDWIKQYLKQQGIPTKHIVGIHLLSVKKGWGIPGLMQRLERERLPTDDVYLVGCTNVGKSALVNRLLSEAPIPKGANKDEIHAKRRQLKGKYSVTSSAFPGTTMGTISIPLRILGLGSPAQDNSRWASRERHVIDTPGLVQEQQLIHRLPAEAQQSLMKQPLHPTTFRLEQGQSILLSPLARVDILEAPSPILFTMFTHIAPHITKTSKLLDTPDSSHTTLCDPSLEPLPGLVRVNGIHRSHASVDFAFASLGWMAIAGQFDQARFRIWLPKGTETHGFALREPPMLPYEFRGSVRKFFGSGLRAVQ